MSDIELKEELSEYILDCILDFIIVKVLPNNAFALYVPLAAVDVIVEYIDNEYYIHDAGEYRCYYNIDVKHNSLLYSVKNNEKTKIDFSYTNPNYKYREYYTKTKNRKDIVKKAYQLLIALESLK